MAARRSTPRQQPQRSQPAAARPAPARGSAAQATAAIMKQKDPSSVFDDEEDGEAHLVKVDVAALESITKSEIREQVDTAHRYPRNVLAFLEEAKALVSVSPETAQSCMYRLERFDAATGQMKPLVGPSVRLAEMCASSWRNLHTAARIIDIGAAEVTAQALCWDLEKNIRIGIEVQRGIMTSGKGGRAPKRYGDDMIRVTCMAAISIALRNAIFRVIPKALVDEIFATAQQVATGPTDEKFQENRARALAWLDKNRVPQERAFAQLGIGSADEITRDHLAMLIGIANAVKAGERTIDECFPVARPAPTPGTVSKATAAEDLISRAKKSTPPPPPANDGAITAEQVLAELHAALEEWQALDRTAGLAIIETWSPAEMRIAYDWAVANNDPDVTDDQLPERPSFVDIAERQPGEEG